MSMLVVFVVKNYHNGSKLSILSFVSCLARFTSLACSTCSFLLQYT